MVLRRITLVMVLWMQLGNAQTFTNYMGNKTTVCNGLESSGTSSLVDVKYGACLAWVLSPCFVCHLARFCENGNASLPNDTHSMSEIVPIIVDAVKTTKIGNVVIGYIYPYESLVLDMVASFEEEDTMVTYSLFLIENATTTFEEASVWAGSVVLCLNFLSDKSMTGAVFKWMEMTHKHCHQRQFIFVHAGPQIFSELFQSHCLHTDTFLEVCHVSSFGLFRSSSVPVLAASAHQITLTHLDLRAFQDLIRIPIPWLIRITSVQDPPFNYQLPNGTWVGILFDLVDDLARLLDFRYIVTEPMHGLYGADEGNGSYDGMIGMLQRKEADVALAILTLTKERSQVVDFGPGVILSGYSLFQGVPYQNIGNPYFCFEAFSPYLWGLLACMVLGNGFLLYGVTLLESRALEAKLKRDGVEMHANFEMPSLNNSLWQVLGLFLYQGMSVIPRSPVSRVVVAALWLWALVVAATYTGNLVAFLATPKLIQRVNSLQEAVDKGIQIGIQRSNVLSDLLSKSQESIHQTIWKSILEKDSMVTTYEEGLLRAKSNKNFAYLEWKEIYNTFKTNTKLAAIGNQCDFMMSKDEAFPTIMSIAFQKKSPILEEFSKHIHRATVTGLIQRLIHKWRRQGSVLCDWQLPKSTKTPITTASAQGMYYLLASGILVSAVVLFGEMSIYCYNGRKKEHG